MTVRVAFPASEASARQPANPVRTSHMQVRAHTSDVNFLFKFNFLLLMRFAIRQDLLRCFPKTHCIWKYRTNGRHVWRCHFRHAHPANSLTCHQQVCEICRRAWRKIHSPANHPYYAVFPYPVSSWFCCQSCDDEMQQYPRYPENIMDDPQKVYPSLYTGLSVLYQTIRRHGCCPHCAVLI